jgi:ATP-dependent Lon protease
MSSEHRIDSPLVLPVLSLRGLVLFPEMLLQFDVGRKKSILALNAAMKNNQTIFLAVQTDIREEEPALENHCPVGLVATVRQVLRQPGDGVRILVEGLYRARVKNYLQEDPFVIADIEEVEDKRYQKSLRVDAMVRATKDVFERYLELAPRMAPDVVIGVQSCDEPGKLADYIASNIMLEYPEKQMLLCEPHPVHRLEALLGMLTNEIDILSLESEISQKVKEQIDENQREYYLREQLRVISEELGEGDNPQEEADEFRQKILKLRLPEEISETLLKECDRMFKMPFGSHEANVIRSYLDTCLALPWNKLSKISIDIDKARKVLDKDHYGLEKVKDRIIELLAAKKLSSEMKGQILCLVGPPGVGKTSIARSVARAIGSKYVRVALGGVHDESDIRGHRRTYIGAMPGRIIAALKQAGTRNPLLLLDEIDKLGNDSHGDPTSALLEVLDAEQNNTFHDHYVDLPFDLSDVFFVTTANDYNAIPAPLLDRMDVITLSSYTHEEKFQIAKRHLLPKQRKRHSFTAKQVAITDAALHALIENYTREAGVRTLERTIATIMRKCAKKFVSGEATRITVDTMDLEPLLGPQKFKNDVHQKEDEVGVVTGLAWTSIGGETMPIEVAAMEGSGKIELTGSLGDVMKESAHAAISCVRCRAKELNIKPDFYKTYDIHIHVPEGAIPKDGPSAGIAMATAVVSALRNTPVRHEVAMTGEITLRGRVLPIGGLKEKTMAAYRNGIKTVIIPKENLPDLAEIDDVVKEALQFIPADTVDVVFDHALLPAIQPGEKSIPKVELPAVPGAKSNYLSCEGTHHAL